MGARTFLSALLTALLVPTAAARAQDASAGWDDPRALALVEQARAERGSTAIDPDLRAYSAIATGHVFFLVDRPNGGDRSLIKADQIALQVFWRAPRETRQRIVGLRDRKVLPTKIRYHLDHLTVVQDDFGDQIRLGDGDEVAAVVHPAAPGSERVYQFRLADSLTISLGGDGADVQVTEIEVRPRDPKSPGFVGSLFIDRKNGAIVRMTFTFTPASYVDRELDYIRISLDNSLWEGRFWLPYRQEIEIRRELPQLDFLVGSVIRGRFEIGDYEFNPAVPPDLFAGPRVTQVPRAERESYPFVDPLVPESDARELMPTPTLQEVRAQALTLMRGRYLSGLSHVRLHLPAVSDVFRWNRVEGAVVGLGAAYRPTGWLALQAHGGWSFGRAAPTAILSLTGGEARPGTGIRASWNERHDLGLFPGAADALNTVAALTTARDWTDPWIGTGVETFHAFRAGGLPVRLAAGWERQESGVPAVDAERAADFRRVRGIDDGDAVSLGVTVEPSLAPSLRLALSAGVERLAPKVGDDVRDHAVLLGSALWESGGEGAARRLAVRLDGGYARGDVPRQRLFLLGGAGTLIGQPYRAQVGDRFWLAGVEGSRRVWGPWITARAFAAAGRATLSHPDPQLEFDWGAGDERVRASLGGGVGLLWDVLHLDVGRGVDGGEWELVVSVDRRFQGWL